MVLLIDNYDSFTYNLYQYIGVFEPDIRVVRNDKITVEKIKAMAPDHIVLSPGPKSPKEAGICMDVVIKLHGVIPILGICLGHQSIGAAFGATVSYAKELCHGKRSLIRHTGQGLFEGMPQPLYVARYHSLAVIEDTLPDCFRIDARTEDGEIMAITHKEEPLFGIQFHPESIYTEHGKRMIETFLKCKGGVV